LLAARASVLETNVSLDNKTLSEREDLKRAETSWATSINLGGDTSVHATASKSWVSQQTSNLSSNEMAEARLCQGDLFGLGITMAD